MLNHLEKFSFSLLIIYLGFLNFHLTQPIQGLELSIADPGLINDDDNPNISVIRNIQT